jgi:undecaprenyl-diphosphatase
MPIKTRGLSQRLRTAAFSTREGFIVVSEILVGIIYFVFSLLVFFYFTQAVIDKHLYSLDMQITTEVLAWRSPVLTMLMELLTSLGGQVPFILVSLGSIFLLIKKHRKEALLFSLALSIGTLIGLFFKYVIGRPRPEVLHLTSELTPSFPSSHAMNAFIFCALLSYFSFHFFRNKKVTVLLTVLSMIYVLVVGFSRVYLGVHYFSDVVAGYIAGFWWFVTVLLLDKTLIFYKLYKKTE